MPPPRQVQAALSALSTIGGAGGTVNVVESQNGNGNVYTVTFGGGLLDTPFPIRFADSFVPAGGKATVPVPTLTSFSLGTPDRSPPSRWRVPDGIASNSCDQRRWPAERRASARMRKRRTRRILQQSKDCE